ncbi:metallophosphoesterase family protein [Shimazuella kribbensis]|uniref:metallophosphoesterase family protein n=1 Tax=Shimazuella kribbensis TaxID=139808 RepID=UPI0003F6B6A8|nr:metallophosphoesterase family protein [Shimazuella kribbensis]
MIERRINISGLSALAVISDIHGNSWALDAVLEDIERRGITNIVNLGDSIYGPLDPVGTIKRLSSKKIKSIKGNQDRVLLTPTTEVLKSKTYVYVKESLTSNDLSWIENMPATLSFFMEEFFLCHGTPTSDETCLLEDVTSHGVFLRSSEYILRDLKDINEPVILCAHSHIPRTVYLSTGQIVINPGSIGLPAYSDDFPFPHQMESGCPHANYTILSKQYDKWIIEHIIIPYDWKTASKRALENGREDWAKWILYGRV